MTSQVYQLARPADSSKINQITGPPCCTLSTLMGVSSEYVLSSLSTPNLIRVQVPQMSNYNTGPGLQSGGMTVYYFQPGGTAPLVAFKKVCLPTFFDSFYLVRNQLTHC